MESADFRRLSELEGQQPVNRKLIPLLLAFSVVLAGCASLHQFLAKPSVRVDGITLESLDGAGMIFRCDYSINNPYPVGITAASASAEILYNGTAVVSLGSITGVSAAANSVNRNSLSFRLPYNEIIRLAGEAGELQELEFVLDGGAQFDLSAVPSLKNRSLYVPFSTVFRVPVFKPEISVTGGMIMMPSVGEVAEAFVRSGMNIFRAGIAAGKFILGEPVEGPDFEDIELDVGVRFDLTVKNTGGADFELEIRKCGIESDLGSLLVLRGDEGPAVINSDGESTAMSAVVNTLEFGAFIAGLAGGELVNTSLVVDGGVTFPEYPDYMRIPVHIEMEFDPAGFEFSSKQ